MSDSARAPDVTALAQKVPRGWGLVIRHYEAPDRTALVEAVVAICRARGVVALVAGDAQLAKRVGADGVHIPEGMIGKTMLGRITVRGSPLVTASAHGAKGLRRAALIGADAVLLSPVFATPSHHDARPLGRMRFAALVRGCRSPVYALGGVKRDDVRSLRAIGAAGIAGISLLNEV